MAIYKYTRPEINENYYADPEVNYGDTTIEQTAFNKDQDYICYVNWDTSVLPDNFNFVSMTDTEAIEWCNTNIEHNEGEEFTIQDGRIQDNRVLEII